MSNLEIRRFESLQDFALCVRFQEEVWGVGFSERVSLAILKVSQRIGGVAAGAYDQNGELVGFVFGMTGYEDGAPVHWSDMLAVREGLRDSGLGTRLKAYQRDEMLRLGAEKIYWTFDPLESRNAYVNFAKLGIVVREYQPDMYGATDSPLHAGMSTDRLIALWLIDTARVRDRMAGKAKPPGPEAADGATMIVDGRSDDLPQPVVTGQEPEGERVLVTIPADIQSVKARSIDVAMEWRRAVRDGFLACLDAGYEARELLRDGDFSRYVFYRK
jgi:predicted GNAT superfamily acetyltransferase